MSIVRSRTAWLAAAVLVASFLLALGNPGTALAGTTPVHAGSALTTAQERVLLGIGPTARVKQTTHYNAQAQRGTAIFWHPHWVNGQDVGKYSEGTVTLQRGTPGLNTWRRMQTIGQPL